MVGPRPRVLLTLPLLTSQLTDNVLSFVMSIVIMGYIFYYIAFMQHVSTWCPNHYTKEGSKFDWSFGCPDRRVTELSGLRSGTLDPI